MKLILCNKYTYIFHLIVVSDKYTHNPNLCVFIFKILTALLLKIVVLWDVYALSTGKQLLMLRKIIIINLKLREPKKFKIF